ncbi:MAG: glycerophosphodiester phosphodiesterase [Woeseiaceae bacterium]|nr:glycerophosphodiester phosphodiesterase [Gammaproteobacteria bacterium]NNK25118.1 glycerophosphodiester phosphodiesterase [Woeseiaceae bacterium]
MRPVIIAHRGACGHLPEHTLPAKALAYAMGADYLEQDLVATRDDELIVTHDIHLDRVTDVARRFPGRARPDGRYYARDFDLEEILTLAVHERVDGRGQQVFPQRQALGGRDFRVHSFARELELVDELRSSGGHEVGIYPEIKEPGWHRAEGVDLTRLVLDTLGQFGYVGHADPVYLQCFDEAELRRIRHELGCRLKLVQLIGEDDWSPLPTNFRGLRNKRGLEKLARTVDGIGPWVNQLYRLRKRDGRVSDSGLVARAHDQGLTVHPYTFRSDALPAGFDDIGELMRFSIEELAIDGLFTDFPDVAAQFLRQRTG